MSDLALVVFDVAGTTVKDAGQVPAAFVAALTEHGVRITADEITNIRGASKREAIARLLRAGVDHAQRVDAVYRSFRDQLAIRYASVEAVEGAAQTFAWLKARGVRVALNTGFDRTTTNLLLSTLEWTDDVVDAVVCGDEVAHGRPAPDLIYAAMAATGIADARRVANVGDTTLDLEAADNAGAGWNIGVLSGAHDRERLMRAPHTHLIASVADLLSLWGDLTFPPGPAAPSPGAR